MSKKMNRQAVPSGMLSKEFLSQFKTEEDVSQFLKDLHAQVREQMLQGEMDSHLGYERHSQEGYNTGNSRNGSFPKCIQTEHGAQTIEIPRDRKGDFELLYAETPKSGIDYRTTRYFAICQGYERL